MVPMDEIVAFARDDLGFYLEEVHERQFRVPRAEVEGFLAQGFGLEDIASLFIGQFVGRGLSIGVDFSGRYVLFNFPLDQSLGTRIIRTGPRL